ncbi:MAG: hypothetical protein IJ501_04820 [Bacilli bacterium]|nr:hypothetical protein [Bacilli bacterium]
MVSKELMKNKDRLERIEVIREVRRKLGNFRLMSNEEKAIALKALNDYEYNLTTDITRSINNIREFEEQGISHDIEVVDVPVEVNKPTYPEFATAGSYESLDENIIRLKDLLFHVPSENIPDDEKRVFLESLRDYCYDLQKLKYERDNNRKAYGDEYLSEFDEVQLSPEVATKRPYTPKMTQQQRLDSLAETLSNSSKSK